jgi:hypothetical protein
MTTLTDPVLETTVGGQLDLPPPPPPGSWWDDVVAGLSAEAAAARWAEWYAVYGQHQQ